MAVVFVTGATGMIGPETLLQLADIRPRLRLLVLVRAPDAETGHRQLQNALTESSDPFRAARAMAMIEAVPGDVTKPESLEDPRLDQVTHVLHMAANTSYWNSPSIDVVNIDGTRHVAERARRMKRLERFAFVSTGYSYGRTPNVTVREVPIQQEEPDCLVRYARSKARAEAMLATVFSDLPTIIIRPSVLVGHTRDGMKPSPAILWSIRVLDTLNISCGNPRTHGLDIVPIDWSMAATIQLLLKPRLKARIYHVSAGAAARSFWQDTADGFNRYYDGGTRPRRWEYFATEAEAERIAHNRFEACFGLGTAFERLMLKSHILYMRFAHLNTTFDNSNLLAEGIAPTQPLAHWLPTYLSIPPDQPIRAAFAQDHQVPITAEMRAKPVRRWGVDVGD